jgi:hypothetical protein
MGKITPQYKCYVEKDKLTVKDRGFKTYLYQLKDGEYFLTIKKKKATRSLRQNAFLWGVVYGLVSEFSGMLPEEVHDHCKMRFLQKRVGKFQTLGSTTRLNKIEFGEYIDKIKHWAFHDLGVQIPDPDSVDY